MNVQSMFRPASVLLLASAAAFVLVAAGTKPADAGIIDSVGTWEGSGTAQDVSGSDVGPFTVSVTRKSAGPNKLRTDGKVILESGREIVFWQEMEEKGARGFSLVTNKGAGGGQCFSNGMCQSYEQTQGGHAFATTLVKDGTDKVRILVTELDGGRAVRFFQQSLTRK